MDCILPSLQWRERGEGEGGRGEGEGKKREKRGRRGGSGTCKYVKRDDVPSFNMQWRDSLADGLD